MWSHNATFMRQVKFGSDDIARKQNTFAKMQRELEKKRKADEKRKRRQARKSQETTEESREFDPETSVDLESGDLEADV